MAVRLAGRKRQPCRCGHGRQDRAWPEPSLAGRRRHRDHRARRPERRLGHHRAGRLDRHRGRRGRRLAADPHPGPRSRHSRRHAGRHLSRGRSRGRRPAAAACCSGWDADHRDAGHQACLRQHRDLTGLTGAGRLGLLARRAQPCLAQPCRLPEVLVVSRPSRLRLS
jgi:hypothetical protein